ncbi:unnamed protein product [Linum tenue]|uniref:Ubiquitin-like domain-containing protein n=1 Tax=Linum tenue TaxID=586396 RepID=A0AAV0IQQ1_9ROSI|nr:unnamed protein product [Linum tenue]
MEGGKSQAGTVIDVTVKFSGRSIPVSVPLDSAIKDLKALLQPLTNVLPRGQKLIFKGKLLADAMTLRESEVTSGAKIMLLASQGLHQGDGPILKNAATRPISRDKMPITEKGKAIVPDKNRLERWKSTGVIALAECNLKVMPDDIWGCGTSARALDISNNSIQEIPSKLGCLSCLQVNKLLTSITKE